MGRRTAGFLRENAVQLILHSDLTRARETAQGLFGREAKALAIPVVETKALRERGLQRFIGRNSFERRVKRFLREIALRKESNIVLVGHDMFFRCILGYDPKRLSGLDDDVFPNAATYSVKIDAFGRVAT